MKPHRIANHQPRRSLGLSILALGLLALGLLAPGAASAAPFFGVKLSNDATEVQAVFVDATGGKFALSFGEGGSSASETAEVSATATATQLETALDAVPNIAAGGGSVVVTGGPGNAGATTPYLVFFSGGPLATTDVPQMTAHSGSLTPLSGGAANVTVTTTRKGGVSHSDQRIDYTANVENIAAAAHNPSIGNKLFCNASGGTSNVLFWQGTPRPSLTYTWLRNGQVIPGATGQTYIVTAFDEGKPIQCYIKGTNPSASSAQASLPPVIANPQPVTAPPTTPNANLAASRASISGTGTAARTCSPPINWTGAAFATASTTNASKTLTGVITAQGTGTLTEGSKNVTAVVNTVGASFLVGQTITGTGIPAGTTVAVVGAGTLELSAAVEAGKSGTGVVLSAGAQPFAVGEQISGTGIPANTTITAVSGQTLTISANATATASGVGVSGVGSGIGNTNNGSNTISSLVTAAGTGNLTAASTTVSSLTTTSGRWAIGMPISGNGIPAGTTVTAATATSLTLSNPVEAGKSGTAVSLTSTGPLSFAVGQEITAPGIPAGTTVTAVSAGSLTLSAAATATATAVPISGTAGGKWSFQWLRNAEEIAGATTYTYVPSAADTGKVLQCRVTGSNAGGSVVASSENSTVGTVSGPPSNGAASHVEVIVDPTTVNLELPAGLETYAYLNGNSYKSWLCEAIPASGATHAQASCFYARPLEPGKSYEALTVAIALGEDAPTQATVTARVTGGGTPEPAITTSEFTLNPFEEFGVQAFEARLGADANEIADYTQAGGHPVTGAARIRVSTRRLLNDKNNFEPGKLESVDPLEPVKTIVVNTPRGFVGNPSAIPQFCPGVEDVLTLPTTCPKSSTVGAIKLKFHGLSFTQPIYAIQPEFGVPAQFAFTDSLGNIYIFTPHLRPNDGYAISFVAAPAPVVPALDEAVPTLCGFGYKETQATTFGFKIVCYEPGETGANTVPLITNPTRCAGPPPTAEVLVDSSEHPGALGVDGFPVLSDSNWKSKTFTNPPLTGCDQVPFEPESDFRPTSHQADSPTGLSVELAMPTNGLEGKDKNGNPIPNGISQANLKKVRVIFPAGMQINASAGDGLGFCTPEEVKLHTNQPIECPDSSKIGNIEIETPLLQSTLTGAIYIAKQGAVDGSPIGLYLVFESKKDGVLIKIPGKVTPDPKTGQLVATFDESPEDPFSRVAINFNQGPRSALVNPPKCGKYAIVTEMEPWTAANLDEPDPSEVVKQESQFEVTEGPDGGPCPSGALEPKLSGGTMTPTAGAKSPFVLRLHREDGSDRFTALSVTSPPGLSAYLRGIPYCPDSVLAGISGNEFTGRGELEHPSCPAASQIGTASAGAGAGPDPFFVGSKVYLTGPYKGAPLSMTLVTPAVAGPLDLGSVVVRNALYVNRTTAQVTVKSDPIPTMLHGILLDIRDIRVNIDRPGFTVNPTNCEPFSIGAQVNGLSGASASVSTPFQVGGCANLGFGPKLKAHLSGATRRGGLPAFTAEINFPEGQANIKNVQVTIPHSEFLEQAHIDTICTRVQAAANECPAGSIYGYAEAETPLLNGVLQGPVFLKSSDHKLPDLAIALRGPDDQPVEAEFAGRIDSVGGQIRDTIEGLPDVPVSRFVLRMKGGKKGLLTNSRNLCASKVTRMTVRMVGQNNRVSEYRPPLNRSCGAAGKKKSKRHRAR